MRQSPPQIPLRLWALAATTGAGAFVAMLDSTATHLALDTIRADLAVTLGAAQWIATGYLIALAVVLPMTGWLIRRCGHGRVWAASLVGFVLASVLCASSGSLPELIAARVLQGLAAGTMVPAGQAVLAEAADRRQLGRLMGSVGFAVALGPALGPWLGGWLVGVSWRWIFWLNLPVGMLALLAASRWLPRGQARVAPPPDAWAMLLAGLGFPLALYGAAGLAEGGRGALAAVIGALLLAAFVVRSLHATQPLIELRLLRRPGFAATLATVALAGAGLYGGLLLLPLYLQHAVGASPAAAGGLLLAMGLGSACALPLAGHFTDRHGAGPVCLAGAAMLLLGTVPFMAPFAWAPAALVCVLLLRGAGLALAQMPAMTAAYAVAGHGHGGDAATLVNIAQRLGGAVGAIAVVALVEHGGARAYPAAFASLAAAAALAAVTALVLPGNGHRDR